MTNRDFTIPRTLIVPDLFKHSFGIIYNEGEPEIVEFESTDFQSKYYNSLPMHSSQVLIDKTETVSTYQLKVHITFDLIQEFLSYGSKVKVLKPSHLIENIKEELNKSILQYSS